MKRYIFPLILGLGGCAILLSLGFWQLRRLEWKETHNKARAMFRAASMVLAGGESSCC